VADDGALRRAVNAEDSDAGIASTGDVIVVREQLEEQLGLVLQEGSRRLRAREKPPPPLPVRPFDVGAEDSGELQSLAFVAVILLYGQLIGYGFWLASGIVEEKASRIVEVLLAAIRPRALLLGKIVGIGVVGFGQLLLIGIVGAGLGIATGTVELASDAIGALAVVLAWFVLGYAFYACMFAMAGALVPRQEDVQNSTGPLTVVLVGSFLLSFGAIEEPAGTLAQVLSLVPPTAPMVSPVRMIAGDMPLAEIVLSVAVLLASAALLVAVAARVYANAVLRTSTRVRLLEAWRAPQS
jgi:ABC-2 type transport system permease protein